MMCIGALSNAALRWAHYMGVGRVVMLAIMGLSLACRATGRERHRHRGFHARAFLG